MTFEDLAAAVVEAELLAHQEALSRPQTSCKGYDGSERISVPVSTPNVLAASGQGLDSDIVK